jgi:4-oxalocrotonate tautomerase
MPHVTVKMYAGRTEQQKARLAQELTRTVMSVLGCAEKSVSVGIEDVAPSDWAALVYEPDILGKTETIYKKPNY